MIQTLTLNYKTKTIIYINKLLTLILNIMKKILFVAFAATLLAAGCQKTEVINRVGDRIGFTTELGKITKSVGDANADNDGETNLLAQDFRVWAYYVAADENTGASANDNYDGMLDKVVKAPGTIENDVTLNGWTPDKAYYWPGKGKDLKFFAVSGVEATEAVVNQEQNTITISPFTVDKAAADVDLMVADFVQQNQGDKGDSNDTAPGKVHFKFNHALSKVEFKFQKAEGTTETIFVQSLTVGTTKDGKVEGGLIDSGILTASTEDANFGTEDASVQNTVKLDWDTSASEMVVFEDDWNEVAAASEGYPATYTAIGGSKVTVDETKGEEAMIVTAKPETFTTWLMIPQTIYSETQPVTEGNPETVVEGKTVTITYLIDSRQFKVIFPLYVVDKLEKWDVNQYVKYTVTLSPNKITFGASVNDWKGGDVNLDESAPDYVQVVPSTPTPETPETPVTPEIPAV